MPKFVTVGISGIEPTEEIPAKVSVLSGTPKFTSWSVDEAAGGISAGVWQATPGRWQFENEHWEYCRILTGVSIVTEEGGTAHTVRAAVYGEAMPANRMSKYEVFIGTWNTTGEVLETEAGLAGTLSATDTYQWLPGKHFIVHDVDARFDGKPTRSMEVMGFDASKKQYFARSFDDQGSTEVLLFRLTVGAGASAGRPSDSVAASILRRTGCENFGSSKAARPGGSRG